MSGTDGPFLYRPEPDLGAGFSWAWAAFSRYSRPLMWAASLRLVVELTDLAVGAPSAIESWSNGRPGANPYQFHGSALELSTWISIAGLLLLAKTIMLVVSSALVFSAAKMAADGETPSAGVAWRRIPWAAVTGLACLEFANVVVGRIVVSQWAIIPAMAVRALLMLLLAASVDDRAGLISAAKRVVEMLRQHFWLVVLASLLAGFIGPLGRALCGVGVVFTVPFSALLLLFIFRAVAGETIPWWAPTVQSEEAD